MALSFLYNLIFKEASSPVSDHIADASGVAAGDPAQAVMPAGDVDTLPETVGCGLEEINPKDFKIFDVAGNSMTPRDISNGDKLLCRPVSETDAVGNGEFLVIAVDRDYYNHKGKQLKFQYKLRHALMPVLQDCPFESLVEKLKEITVGVYLPENQRMLKTKYEEAIEFYGKDRQLMVSETFKNGELRYSFHPMNLIRYVGVYALSRQGHRWQCKKL